MRNKSTSILAFTLLCIGTLQSQFQMGANPTGQKWQILNSPSVRVIYPNGMEAKAQRIAGMINYIDVNNKRSVGKKSRRLDIVLQNQTVNPNGYVTLSPFRSEFYATPPAGNNFLGSIDWLDVLSIHEYRHAQQYVNQKVGIVKLMYLLQGEPLWALLNSIVTPSWYFEGDAVIMETALTNSGRGRAAFFTLEQRAMAMAGKNFSYQKNRNDSYKDNLPDQYRLGFMMLSKIRNGIGNDTIANVLKQAAGFRGLTYPFSKALKRNTGFNSTELYNAAWEDRKKQFSTQIKSINFTANEKITKEFSKVYTQYRFPNIAEDGTIYVRKNSFDKTHEIVAINGANETKIASIGFNNDDYLNYRNKKLAWAEITKNARRGNQTFSDIMIYDLASNTKKSLTAHTKYFSPTISPGGRSIVAVHISPTQENEIHLLDINSGTILDKIQAPLNYVFSRLSWSQDGKNIVTIAKHKSKLAIIKIDIENKDIVQLTPWTSHTMEAPVVQADKVYFTASFTGIDNIFSVNLDGNQSIQQISNVPLGAYESNISSDGDYLVYSEYNYMGYHLSKQKLNDRGVKNIILEEPKDMAIYDNEANVVEGGSILEKDFEQSYKSQPYNALFKGMKLYRWGVTPSIASPSIKFGMINLLRDAELNFSGTLNRNESKSLNYSADLRIARFYTDITLTASQGTRSTDFYSTADTLAAQKFNESALGGSVALPLSWLKGNYATFFDPKVSLHQRVLTDIKQEFNLVGNSNITELKYSIGFSAIRRRAYQNLFSRLGVSFIGENINSIGETKANKTVLSSKFFLPGLLNNHSLRLGASYQKENLSNLYQFTDLFNYARGFITPINDNYSLFSAEYALPLLYPDIAIAGITYFKRVSANLFYDTGISENKRMSKINNYTSAGVELLLDNTILNLGEIRVGIRYSHLLKDPLQSAKKSKIEFFFGDSF